MRYVLLAVAALAVASSVAEAQDAGTGNYLLKACESAIANDSAFGALEGHCLGVVHGVAATISLILLALLEAYPCQ